MSRPEPPLVLVGQAITRLWGVVLCLSGAAVLPSAPWALSPAFALGTCVWAASAMYLCICCGLEQRDG